MKTVIINFTDADGKKTKSFASSSLKVGLVDKIFEIAEKAPSLQESANIKDVKEFYEDLQSLLVSVFGYKFSLDELKENVDQEEMMRVFNEICKSLGQETRKN